MRTIQPELVPAVVEPCFDSFAVRRRSPIDPWGLDLFLPSWDMGSTLPRQVQDA
jgi:hypothetical protein